MKPSNKSLALVTLLLIVTHGASSTLAQTLKTERFHGPGGIALDSKGNLYVGDRGLIRKITPGGVVSTLAGGGSDRGGPDGSNADGTGSEAVFQGNDYMAVDGADNLYVTWLFGDRIRRITPAGVVTTLVKELRDCQGVAADHAGNIYFAERGFVRKIASDGTVTTLAGQYPTPEKPLDKHAPIFSHLGAVAADSRGNVYIIDGYTIRKITPDGVVTTIAGASGMSRPVDGPGSAARFADPRGIAIDSANNLYVTDQNTVRKVTPEGVVSTMAGKYGIAGGGSKDGIKDAAQFMKLFAIAVDKADNIYVADQSAHTIRKITPAGVVSTLAGKVGITDEEQDRAIQEDENRRHGR